MPALGDICGDHLLGRYHAQQSGVTTCATQRLQFFHMADWELCESEGHLQLYT